MEKDFRIAIIGLGLIGGSLAYALKGFKKCVIAGCDIDSETRRLALKNKAVNFVYEKAGDAIENSDVVFFCTYPDSIHKIIEINAHRFKTGAGISAVCGVKSSVSESICSVLPEGVDYVGGHPMAGKEMDGFVNASSELFWMSGYIITPVKTSKKESVELIREIAKYIGSTRITIASPEEHDSVIAYTSDLMHIAASALCLSYPEKMNRAYTAGSFRDCTRVARINPKLWSELFLANRKNVLNEIDRLIENLSEIRYCIDNSQSDELYELLDKVCKNKITMQEKEPEPWKN